ncbi:MAG: type II secretion system F family protein [Methanoregulaceae archaeon]|nr:type II secretion system F family protein [Methanoregulaceae archaeon]
MATRNPFSFLSRKPAEKPLTSRELEVVEDEQRRIVDRLEYDRSHQAGFGRFVRHPFRVLIERSENILIVSVPVAILFFLIGTAVVVNEQGMTVFMTTTLVDDIGVFSILIAIVPLAILDFRESSRVRHLEDALPNFFRDLAGMNDSGMTLPNAVHLVAAGEYSTLTPHIRKMDNEMSWNIPFVEAIYRFGQSLRTPLADRSVDLIAKASKAGGDASEVLRAAAVDTYEFITLQTDRRNNMLIYVIIVLISFMVFLFVIFVLVSTFLSTMASAASAQSAAGGSAQFIKNLDLFFYTRIFAHAAMIQGFFSGLVAGQMGEGRVTAGLKYSAIMLFLAWVAFRFFV